MFQKPGISRTAANILTCCFILWISSLQNSAAQEADPPLSQYWDQRDRLSETFATELDAIITDCRSSGLADTAGKLGSFLFKRDPQKQYLFVAPENTVGESAVAEISDQEIRLRSRKLLSQYAEALFRLAREQAEAGRGAIAIQLLHELLFYDPNHSETRRVLGHRAMDIDGVRAWRVTKDRFSFRKAKKAHSEFGWSRDSWSIASTRHFVIESRADEAATNLLAEKLELWFEIWRQVFFDYHSRSATLSRWLDGKGSQSVLTRKFKVIFFADREDYVAGLSDRVPGIEASTGYYHDGQRQSYFFASDDDSIHETWRHELVHQLFQESRRNVLSPFADRHLWLGEGIAMYMESLVEHPGYVTVGGFESRRLQYARKRRLGEQFYVPLAELAEFGLAEFQAREDLAKLYSQSAGITHFLMTADRGATRIRLIEFLQLSYRGKLKAETFEKLIGRTCDAIDRSYVGFLRVDVDQLQHLSAPESRRELCLIGAELQTDSLFPVGQCTRLRWLDLSGCDIRGNRLKYLSACKELRQLFLADSKVNNISIPLLLELPIVELDLAGSNLNDEQLIMLLGLKTLRSLDVTGTRVSSHGIKTVSSRRPDIDLKSDFGRTTGR